ncbi:MAG: alpha/beta hydrolase family protein, partial [Burkholderiales bacterium]
MEAIHAEEFLPWPKIVSRSRERFSGTLLVRSLVSDPGQWYFLYLPRCDWKDAPIVVSVHGITRNAYEHAMLFAPYAERHGVILIAPLFTRERHRRYQRLGREREVARADVVLDNIIADTCVLTRGQAHKVYLFGYSGGGQFVHRYAFAHPGRVAAIVIGAAGWYTFPDREMPYPQGIRSAAFEFDPAEFLTIPATVFVGENDTGRDDAFNTSVSLDSHQGETRLERGRRWIEAMREAAAAHRYDTRFEFQTLPGSDHSFLRSVKRGFLAGRVFESLGLVKPAPRRVLRNLPRASSIGVSAL